MNSPGKQGTKLVRAGWAIARFGRTRLLLKVLFVILVNVFLTAGAAAQDDPDESMPKDAEPPPLKVISKEDRKRLDDKPNPKDRVKLSLQLMEERLLSAEGHSVKVEHKEMFVDLGKFHALVDNTIAYLIRNDTGNASFLKNFKLFEMGLRAFLPRLELIRREAPLSFEYYVRRVILAVREARRKAVDPFFDDTVVPNKNVKGNY